MGARLIALFEVTGLRMFFDALLGKIRDDGVVSNKAVYPALGIQAAHLLRHCQAHRAFGPHCKEGNRDALQARSTAPRSSTTAQRRPQRTGRAQQYGEGGP